jgi:hypothetical protein
MLKIIYTRSMLYLSIPIVLLLLSSCSTIEQFSATPTPIPTNTPPPTPTLGLEDKVGTVINLSLPEGDVEYGKSLATKWTCIGCHEASKAGPDFGSAYGEPVILVRAELRLADPNYSGSATTPEEYVIEAILLPEDYVVEGEWKKAMPDYYGELLTVYDLASIMAYLHVLE